MGVFQIQLLAMASAAMNDAEGAALAPGIGADACPDQLPTVFTDCPREALGVTCIYETEDEDNVFQCSAEGQQWVMSMATDVDCDSPNTICMYSEDSMEDSLEDYDLAELQEMEDFANLPSDWMAEWSGEEGDSEDVDDESDRRRILDFGFHHRPRHFGHRHFGKFGKFGHFGRRRAEETDVVDTED